MTVDEMFCRWATFKYGLDNVAKVEFICEEGWQGTDVTPGDPPSFEVIVITTDGERHRQWEEVELVPDLIREICEFSLTAPQRASA